MPIVNLGILAHVDAGKTSLTERILFETGVIAEIGRVDKGTTQTDTLALERQRGITIQSAVVSFRLGDRKINLIDTPGHADFIAEVERALDVLDGVVLVVSAVEGVQPQTRKMVRAIRDLRIPLLLAINKIDRAGARDDALLADIRDKLGLRVVAMNRVAGLGDREVDVIPLDFGDEASAAGVVDLLAERSDTLIDAYLAAGGNLPAAVIRRELAAQVRDGHVVPVYYTSALLGTGVALLLDGIATLLPTNGAPSADPLRGHVFKIQRDAAGEKVALLRLSGGELAVRQPIRLVHHHGDGQTAAYEAKVTGLDGFESGKVAAVAHAGAGDIVRVHGLKEAQIGDTIGNGARPAGHRFALPTLESTVHSGDPARAPHLYEALVQMAEADPLINIRRLGDGGTLAVHLYGEVQKEVIAATLAADFGLGDVTFAPSQIICIERPVGTGAAAEFIGEPGTPFNATVGLRVEPGAVGSGLTYHRQLGRLDHSFYAAIEETVRVTLAEGLSGWQVQDVVVTLTDVGMTPTSVAADYRHLTPLVLMDALAQAGTTVLEPIQRFTLNTPADTLGEVFTALAAARGLAEQTETFGPTAWVTGTMPTVEVHAFEQRLPGLSGGEGSVVVEFDHYAEVAGSPSTRPRSDCNPLNRKEYLACVSQG